MNEERTRSWRGRTNTLGARVVALVAIAAVGLLATESVHGASASYVPLGGTTSIEPNPELEGNVTYANHYLAWAPLEYGLTAGTEANLSAQLSPRVQNPISVNPSTLVSLGTLQGEKVPTASASAYWNSTSYFTTGGAIEGATKTGPTVSTSNGFPTVTETVNISNGGASGESVNLAFQTPYIPTTLYPSQNPQFDYITAIYGLSGPACPVASSCYLQFEVNNGTASNYPGFTNKNGSVITTTAGAAQDQVAPGGFGFVSVSLAQLNSAHAGFNISGAGAATSFSAVFQLLLPKSSATTDVYTITIYGFALGTSPLTFGTTHWGKTNAPVTRQDAFIPLNLSILSPTFSWTDIAGGGYSTAIVERAADLPGSGVSITQSALSGTANATAGGPQYIEQLTYSFTFQLPVAAALSYGSFNLQDRVNVSGAQYTSVSFGGTSYTTAYNGYATCTSTTCTGLQVWNVVQGSETPTTATSWIGIIDFTMPQWDSISVAPGFFTENGIQYYWYLIVIFLGGGLGIGSATWATTRKEGLKVRPGA